MRTKNIVCMIDMGSLLHFENAVILFQYVLV